MGLAGYEKARREFDAEKTTRMVERRTLELLSERGFKIPNKIYNRYKNAGKFPTAEEIDDFDFEYKRRLRDVVGKPDFIRIFIGEHISFSRVMQRFIRSIKSECLDRMLILGERHLAYIINDYEEQGKEFAVDWIGKH